MPDILGLKAQALTIQSIYAKRFQGEGGGRNK